MLHAKLRVVQKKFKWDVDYGAMNRETAFYLRIEQRNHT